MIAIVTVLLVVSGALAAPRVTDGVESYNNADNINLPGVENLGEKSLPLFRLYEAEPTEGEPVDLPGTRNLAEKSQLQEALPGTRNVAEKAIPDYVILRMSRPANERISSHPEIEQIPTKFE